ncbi:hypothetical protein EGW08_021714 [Elysia chlorotica]|uniref:Uncharacterized protein n=1 Tax=Elysia chlorotica TaxID=188477 RepID=A0A433SMT6_ELYCH|nr:hypothetical protein EGW08_021714 [Elysia chlorotica]
MREMSLTQESDVRERVREEYNDLIHSIFNSTFQLRSKFDQFRNELQDDVFDKINETRKEAVDAMAKLQQKFKGTSDDEELKANLSRAEQIRALQNENHHLNQLVLKMKALNSWRQNVKTHSFLKTTSDLRKKAENSRKAELELHMLAEEEVVLLRQQLVASRNAMASTEKDSMQVRKLLQKELKIKSEREHEEAQRERSKQQLEQAKQAGVEKLVDELMDKEARLKRLEEEQDRTSKLTHLAYEKAKRDVDIKRKQLNHERLLKLDAFQRVDTLQSQVYDYESTLLNRPPSAATPSLSKPRSRATSATQLSRRSRPSTTGNQWPPPVSWPANRSLTPYGEFPADIATPLNNESKKIQRPKTVGGRLRSRIAEQLLNELEPDTHRTIVQLAQLQLEGVAGNGASGLSGSGGRRDKY